MDTQDLETRYRKLADLCREKAEASRLPTAAAVLGRMADAYERKAGDCQAAAQTSDIAARPTARAFQFAVERRAGLGAQTASYGAD